jgi:GH18 family chitinase
MRRKVVLSALAALLAAVALAGCGSSSSSSGKVTSAKDRVVVGYYADWDMYVRGFPIYLPLSANKMKRLFDAQHLTHLNYAFAKIDYVSKIVSDRKVKTTLTIVQPGPPSLPANTVGLQKLKTGFAGTPVKVSSGNGHTTFTVATTGSFVDTSVADKLTQLAIDFPQAHITTATEVIPAKVTTTPTIVQVDQMTDPINFKNMKLLRKEFPKLKILISIGGWTLSDKFSSSLKTDAQRKALAKSAIDYMKTNGFDGIDLDWEFPVCCGSETEQQYAAANNGLSRYSPDDRHDLTLWLQELRSELDDLGKADDTRYLLTMAAAAGPDMAKKAYELKELAKIVDWIDVMAYDFHVPVTQVANLSAPLTQNPADPDKAKKYTATDAVDFYEQSGVPASKLVLGVPFYGHGWMGCPPQNHGEFQTCTGNAQKGGTWIKLDATAWGEYDYWDLKKSYIGKNGFTRYWDAKAQVPFLYNAKTGQWISYDDPQSIAAKAKLVRDKGLRGGMFWEAAMDHNQGLQVALYDAIMGTKPSESASAAKQ